MAYKIPIQKKKWIPTDAWRGYEQSAYAVAGSSDTGTWADSPCPSGEVTKEIEKLKAYLRTKGIGSREKVTRSSNVFMAKRWIVVEPQDFAKAKKLADEWLIKNKGETQYIHETD